jgi:hypothetical protein
LLALFAAYASCWLWRRFISGLLFLEGNVSKLEVDVMAVMYLLVFIILASLARRLL